MPACTFVLLFIVVVVGAVSWYVIMNGTASTSASVSSSSIKSFKKQLKTCPEAEANLLSRLTYWWANSLFTFGYRNTITEDDLWELRPEERAEVASKQLEVNWKKEFSKENSLKKIFSENWKGDARLLFTVWKILVSTYCRAFFTETALSLCSTLVSFAHPQLLK